MKITKTFIVAVILNVLFIYTGSEAMFNGTGRVDLLELLQMSYNGMTGSITPLFVCLPYVTRFYEEKESGYYRIKIMRQGELGYAMKHVWQAMLSGAMVMLISHFLYTAIMCMDAVRNNLPICFSGEIDAYGDEYMPTFYYNLVEQGKGWIMYILMNISLLFYGMIWPCYGVVASLFVSNRRLAVVFPFLFKRVVGFMPGAIAYLGGRRLMLESHMAYLPFGGFLYIAAFVTTAFLVAVLGVYLGMKVLMKRQG